MNEITLTISFILNIQQKYPYTYLRILKAKKNNLNWLIQLIEKNTKILNNTYNFYTRIYWFINKLKTFPKCKICGKEICKNIRRLDDPRYTYCSTKCAKIDPDNILKRKITCKLKYGNENYCNSEKIARTRKNFSNEKLQEIKYKFQNTLKNMSKEKLLNKEEKRKNTLFKNYGVYFPIQSSIIKNKIKLTNNKKFGVDWPVQNINIYKKGQNRYTYKNINFDSSWELVYFIWLEDNNIKFEYQPNIQFKYYDQHNYEHMYHPDFLLCDTNEIIEIKGNRFFTNNLPIKDGKEPWYEKYNCMINNNVKILKYTDMKKYIQYVKSKYSKDYLQRFRNK